MMGCPFPANICIMGIYGVDDFFLDHPTTLVNLVLEIIAGREIRWCGSTKVVTTILSKGFWMHQ